ncbi:TonB family protein [Elioraea tepida]|uniref:TonB family protein n=1 Tax=Elioraea tepida TaxID=2843330 RepID=A0A975U4A2_9PROT|nr:energy transducer TonB [Elioraea tepida]QXM25468.1 TonB family protein [Elioraea tepida]
MRVAAAAALFLHAAALALILPTGVLRRGADVAGEAPGIPVVLSPGGGEEAEDVEGVPPDPRDAHRAPEARESAPPAAMAHDASAEAAMDQAASAEATVEAVAETAARTPAETLPPPHEEAATAAPTASTLPLPPPPPPEPPPRRAEARRSGQSPGATAPAASAWSRAAEESAGFGAAALALDTRPATVGRRVDPVVPLEARQRRIEGTVVLAVTVSAAGTPSAVDVLRSSGHLLLDRAAQEALWQWRFDPARRGGVPVEEQVAIPITFRIID